MFELSPQANGTWTEQILNGFVENATDGGDPTAAVPFDANHINLFGMSHAHNGVDQVHGTDHGFYGDD